MAVLRRQKRGSTRKKTLAVTGISAAVVSGLGLLRRRTKEAPIGDNKTIVRELLEETWKGNLDVVDRLVAPGYLGHDPSQPEPIRGIDGVKSFVAKFRESFSSTHVTIEEQISEGDTVATRWTGRGTHTGPISGIAPTGKDVTITGTSISRLDNGRVIEDHTAWDTFGMLVQLGGIRTPPVAEHEHQHAHEHAHEHEHEHEHEGHQEHQPY